MKSYCITLDGSNLRIDDLEPILKGHLRVEVVIDELQMKKVAQSRGTVDLILAKKLPIYGISTGFGKFKDIYIPRDQMISLQRNLIISHASCVGDALPPHQVLIMMILRLNCLVRGYSGVRTYLIDKLCEAINKQIIPKVPCQGSVGASGDLAPLSHLALGLMGMGEIWNGNGYSPSEQVLQEKNYAPIIYMEKEGLAMNNGTQMMATINLETVYRAQRICNIADICLAITAYVTGGIFLFKLYQKYFFQNLANLNSLLHGKQSKTLITLKQYLQPRDGFSNPKSIQSAVSSHSIVHDQLDYCQDIIEKEMNSTSDNPIIDNDNRDAKSGGNFHGEYMAQVADFMSIALQRLCIFSERRQERMVNSDLGNCKLPMFLTGQGGILNGYMIPQYTSAALVSENKVLANPSCVDTVPTSANIEDHVSMGAYGARKALQILKNTEYVVAIELMCAVQALEFVDTPIQFEKIKQSVRQIVPDVKSKDIFMSQYIEDLVKSLNI